MVFPGPGFKKSTLRLGEKCEPTSPPLPSPTSEGGTRSQRHWPWTNSTLASSASSLSNSQRPLPALPDNSAIAAPAFDDSYKVPIDDEPRASPVYCPPPGFWTPGSSPLPERRQQQQQQHSSSPWQPQDHTMRATEDTQPPRQHRLEYQSSVSSNVDSKAKSRSLTSLLLPHRLNRDHGFANPASADPHDRRGGPPTDVEQESTARQGSPRPGAAVVEPSLGQGSGSGRGLGALLAAWNKPVSSDVSDPTQQALAEACLPGPHGENAHDNARRFRLSKPHTPRSLSFSSLLSSAPSSSSLAPAASLSVTSPTILCSPTSPTTSLSFPTYVPPPPPSSSISGDTSGPGDWQPYYPPPPTISSASSIHSPTNATQSGDHSPAIDVPEVSGTVSTAMASGITEPFRAQRSRRHTSGPAPLSIQTQHLDLRKKGPNAGEPEAASRGTMRRHPRNSTGVHQHQHGTIPGSDPSQRYVHGPFAATPSSQPSSHQHPPPTKYHGSGQHHLGPTRPGRARSSSPTAPTQLARPMADTQDRTAMAMMQRHLTRPDDPESEIDIAIQVMISQAAVDSKAFEIMTPQVVENVKQQHATLSSRIAALTARLSLESKIREAAQSLLKLHAENKKLARQAGEHLENSNKKVDQVATELWKQTQLAADLQRTLLQHTSGILALGVVRLEDQNRREREYHALQRKETEMSKRTEEQILFMSKTITSLESDALEAHSLLEDKDRTIERLMKQLHHQREAFVRLEEQQQKTAALTRLQQRDLEVLNNNDAKVTGLQDFLQIVGRRLQKVLLLHQQLQQQQRGRPQRRKVQPGDEVPPLPSGNSTQSGSSRDRTAQKWPSETTLLSKVSLSSSVQNSLPSEQHVRTDSDVPSDLIKPSSSTGATTAVETAAGSKASSPPTSSPQQPSISSVVPTQHSIEAVTSTLDALENFITESCQKMQILESELGLLRRQSVVLSESRKNSVKVKDPKIASGATKGSLTEDAIRLALERSLKEALLEKELARQELENERQKWQEDQNHRISALEQSLCAAEEDTEPTDPQQQRLWMESVLARTKAMTHDEAVQELRRQLREAIEEIDTLGQQQQSSLKLMRQLFDLVPEQRKRWSRVPGVAHQVDNSTSNGSASLSTSGRSSPAGSVSSMTSSTGTAGGGAAIGFSMESLLRRVKDLVSRSNQLERENHELRQQPGSSASSGNTVNGSVGPSMGDPSQQQSVPPWRDAERSGSAWVSKTDLERLQASAELIPLLEKELELLKQHTDMLLDENARLAHLAANTPVQSMRPSSVYAAIQPAKRGDRASQVVKQPTPHDSLEELQEVIRVKDQLLRERDQMVQDQDKIIGQLRVLSASSVGQSSWSDNGAIHAFDIEALERYRTKCGKLESEMDEMRLIVAALESLAGGPGSGAQLVHTAQKGSDLPSSMSWLMSGFGTLATRNQSAESLSPQGSGILAIDNQSSGRSSLEGVSSPPQGIYGTVSSTGVNTPNTAVATATSALRREFRRVMKDLREEKDMALRKEVEERRKLEKTIRQLRRDLQVTQGTPLLVS